METDVFLRSSTSFEAPARSDAGASVLGDASKKPGQSEHLKPLPQRRLAFYGAA